MGMRVDPKVVMQNTDITGRRSFLRAYEGLASWADDSLFSYELSYPSRDHMVDEIMDVMHEVMIEDVYRLQQVSQPGDIWVDAGCHIGIFCIAAMQAGSLVRLGVDADKQLADSARYNTQMFMAQSIARGLISEGMIEPYIVAERITSSAQLVDFNFTALSPAYRRRCLKLDIQGSEHMVLNDQHAAALAKQYEFMIIEYHDADVSDISTQLENIGWSITAVSSHTDTLMNTDTNIIWAESK